MDTRLDCVVMNARRYIHAGIARIECFYSIEAVDNLVMGIILIRESAARNFEALADLLNEPGKK